MSPTSQRPTASVLLPDERIAWSSLLRCGPALRSTSGDQLLPQPLALQMYGAGHTRQNICARRSRPAPNLQPHIPPAVQVPPAEATICASLISPINPAAVGQAQKKVFDDCV